MKIIFNLLVLTALISLTHCMENESPTTSKNNQITVLEAANEINNQIMPNGYINIKETSFSNQHIEIASAAIFNDSIEQEEPNELFDDLIKTLGTIKTLNVLSNKSTLLFAANIPAEELVIKSGFADHIDLSNLVNFNKPNQYKKIEILSDNSCTIDNIDKIKCENIYHNNNKILH